MKRARADLGIGSVRVCGNGQRLSYSLPPGQELPDGLAPESATPEPDAYPARLAEPYPPSTPPDEL